MSFTYLNNILLWVDQGFNTFLFGSPDETFSARCYRASTFGKKGYWVLLRKVVDFLFLPQDWLLQRKGEWTGARHCERSFLSEVNRKHLPHKYRDL